MSGCIASGTQESPFEGILESAKADIAILLGVTSVAGELSSIRLIFAA
jgi:hypothetical protein